MPNFSSYKRGHLHHRVASGTCRVEAVELGPVTSWSITLVVAEPVSSEYVPLLSFCSTFCFEPPDKARGIRDDARLLEDRRCSRCSSRRGW